MYIRMRFIFGRVIHPLSFISSPMVSMIRSSSGRVVGEDDLHGRKGKMAILKFRNMEVLIVRKVVLLMNFLTWITGCMLRIKISGNIRRPHIIMFGAPYSDGDAIFKMILRPGWIGRSENTKRPIIIRSQF
jgi:hypothetical protein